MEIKKRGGKREGAGRKRKDANTPKAYANLISCNVTKSELDFIKDCAKKENISVYKLVKHAVFDYLKQKRYCPPDDKL